MTEIKGDLISRSALEKSIEKYRPKSAVASLFIDGEHCMFMNCITEIDNAPTVNDCPNCEYKKQSDYISSSSSYKELQSLRKFKKEHERPQGEWKAKTFHHCYCTNCNFLFDIMRCDFITDMYYCPKCGADMHTRKDILSSTYGEQHEKENN